jgi:hypothetical protein
MACLGGRFLRTPYLEIEIGSAGLNGDSRGHGKIELWMGQDYLVLSDGARINETPPQVQDRETDRTVMEGSHLRQNGICGLESCIA